MANLYEDSYRYKKNKFYILILSGINVYLYFTYAF